MSTIAVLPSKNRQIGSWDTGQSGPTLLVTAGLHGNEPAGVAACERVIAHLQEHQPALRGRFVALRGNRQALAEQCRFLKRDLNRGWGQAAIDALHKRVGDERSPEDLEQIDLLQCFVDVERSASGPWLLWKRGSLLLVAKHFLYCGRRMSALRSIAAKLIPCRFIM